MYTHTHIHTHINSKKLIIFILSLGFILSYSIIFLLNILFTQVDNIIQDIYASYRYLYYMLFTAKCLYFKSIIVFFMIYL